MEPLKKKRGRPPKRRSELESVGLDLTNYPRKDETTRLKSSKPRRKKKERMHQPKTDVHEHFEVIRDPALKRGVSSHSCSCGKSYRQRKTLHQHILWLSGTMPMPLKCGFEACGASFADRYSLNLHLRDMHQRRFLCKHCAVGYGQMKELDNHVKTCHPEKRRCRSKTFSSNVSNQAFSHPSSLTQEPQSLQSVPQQLSIPSSENPESMKEPFKLGDASVQESHSFLVPLPNLKIILCESLRVPQPDLHKFLETVDVLRRANDCYPELVSLDLVSPLTPASVHFPARIFKQLFDLRLPLRSFAIDIGLMTSEWTFEKLLEIHSATIQNLKVFRTSYAQPYDNFPFRVRMNRLEQLTLVGPICSNLRFLKYTPNLKCFRTVDPEIQLCNKPLMGSELLEGVQPVGSVSLVNSTDFDELEDVVIPSLEEFLEGDAFCYQNEVNQLARVMPNLRTVRLGLDSAGVKAVLDNWKNLKVLHIEPFEVAKELPSHLESVLDSVDEVKCLMSQLSRLQLKVNGSEGDEAVRILTSSLMTST